MKNLDFLPVLLLVISCKSHIPIEPEFSNLSNKNQIEIMKVNNFRFLGGIKNFEGKTLRDSLIYRSGNLHHLKNRSFDDLEKLKINKIIDLRTKQEVAKEIDHLPSNISYKNYPALEDKNDEMKNAKKLALKGKIGKDDADKRMLRFYTDYVSENPQVIKTIITEILDSDQPILYHCTAGKDRTGMITALILKILKFDNDVIFEEYLVSNDLRKNVINKRLSLANNLHFVFPKLDIGVIEKTSWIERDYLQAAFDEIDTKYGSMDIYIHKQLGISEAQREIYIKRFLH
ncbi:tyrosine-protein phosphatase [Epilithonimonas ginsengisoli]|uniref:Tyrosine-protein phosphatase n=1 Tax=Epilithonimonas ginsengisoli TaxID=1245592 RepID=A0ABU4JDF4_9FLAO|nr:MULTISPECIES: tyrosine-protein phosphatase [Chryseobacterium group]MBV6878657.1 tyrosine-protein phosphatase [Epilithonimonas sp. FP105]MDW8547682.1 tyrosine-protein phosphatase [Epilithonimonas ginsengisoli]OAH75272.1 protein tyrosine phosphatase [Chryseobacterium sp. FP211-J200]